MATTSLRKAPTLGREIPWWEVPITWPLWGRLVFGAALGTATMAFALKAARSFEEA